MKKVWLLESEQARWFEFEEPTDMPNEVTVTMLSETEQPAQRTWVGLTDEEIYAIEGVEMKYDGTGEYYLEGEYEFAKAIEAKLKEKNT